jgi:hypothetical protein
VKTAFFIALIFALAGCAAHQPSISNAEARVRAMNEGEHPELAGLTKEQIERLTWRIQ